MPEDSTSSGPPAQAQTSAQGRRPAADPAAASSAPTPATEEELPPTLDEPTAAPRFRDPGAPLPFLSWERYKIVEFLGAGGMGSVFKAIDLRLKRTVAIKFLRANQVSPDDTRQRRRFEREARAQARIEHPHICRIYDVGEVEGQPYIAMQFIAGASLASLQQEMARTAKVRAIRDIAEALHAAHEQGLIHRDIKPANIMVERRPDGTYWPYLLDFGLAREVDGNSLTSMAGIEGTPAFMAPEQARGEIRRLDRRTDLYGLGAALYAVLCGRPPFLGSSTDVLLDALLREPPPMRAFDPAIPADLDTIVLACLEKEPARRYQSAQALAADLDRFLVGARIRARPPSLWRRAGKLLRRHKLLGSIVTTALLATLLIGGAALRASMQAAAQARLAQQLTQEIKDMEWLLRSARQLPLHDLEREKRIVRRRMQQLQNELAAYGELSRGLAHYALGRGHLALHEYPQALQQLQLAIEHGNQSAEVHYARGLVLGKHFEQAGYQARLSGGGEWARKQFQELELKYLGPAIAALQRSRAMKLDAPAYLEALLAFYRRDYDAALQQAQKVKQDAPWMYEADKLAGDVHHQRALALRDHGRYPEAEAEFTAAVQCYESAAAIGQSDAEVYEGLAETWVRRVEMQLFRGQPIEAAYTAAVAASDKIAAAEPRSITGWLKKATAAELTMAETGTGRASEPRVAACLDAARRVLQEDPQNPYASEAAASCYSLAAEAARARGENPGPLWDLALRVLSPALQKHPTFLWGLNALAVIHASRGSFLAQRDAGRARKDLEESLRYFTAATNLDDRYIKGFSNQISCLDELVALSGSLPEARALLPRVETTFEKCVALNDQDPQCYNNTAIFHAQLARLLLRAGEDPRPALARARQRFADMTRVGGSFLDAEQHMALAAWVAAADSVRRRQDPQPKLAELQAALGRCFALAAQDVVCRTLAAQAEWVRADWLAAQLRPVAPALHAALARAELAAQSPEPHPDAWQTLAETHLRLARASALPAVRACHRAAGLAAAARVFALRPDHALGRATHAALKQLAAPASADPAACSPIRRNSTIQNRPRIGPA